MTDIIMPKAGMAMETGKIVKWLVSEGDEVAAGDMILEIETDKVNMEVEAFDSGTVLKLYAQPGDEVPVTQVIGYIGQKGEQAPDAPPKVAIALQEETHHEPAAKSAGNALSRGAKIPATPLAKTLANQRGIDISTITPSGYYGQVKAADVPAAAQAVAAFAAKSTPLARAMADGSGIDLARFGGSERIYAADVQAAAMGVQAMQGSQAAQTKEVALMDGDEKLPMDGMRRIIAKRMSESHAQVPPVTMHTKVDVSGLLAQRAAVNLAGGEKLSINDYIIEACAMSLKQMPEANISFGGDCIIRRAHINIGVAVALQSGGLIVPVIKDADGKDIAALSGEMKALAKKARAGKLSPDEYTGGTFTISNLGMMGITGFTPIINQPESLILGVNAIEKVLTLREDGTLYNREVMGLSLTFDHRAHDGASAAVFLQQVVSTLERFNEGDSND